MTKFVYSARCRLVLAVGAWLAGTMVLRAQETTDVQRLRMQLDTLQQTVDGLQAQSRQVRPNLQNPALSAAVDAIGSYSDAGQNLNFRPRDVELMIQANADPFAKAYIVLNAESELEPAEKSDPFSEATVGMEEAAIQTTCLPGGWSLKAGAFFADFTRLGGVHSHDLPFVDRPASLEQIIGGEDKARGMELSWLPPGDHYLRLTAGAADDLGAESPVNNTLATADGGEASVFASDENRALDTLTCYGRVATLLELGPSAVLHLGADGSRGGQESTRTMASADFKLEWKPHPGANRLLEVAGEWLTSKYEGTLSEEALFEGGPVNASTRASGGYVYAQYRLSPLWQPGIRLDITRPESYEQVDADEDGVADGIARSDATLRTYSAYLTAYLSEFNRLRLQANYLDSDQEVADGHDHDTQIFLQWSVVLGAHKHDFMP